MCDDDDHSRNDDDHSRNDDNDSANDDDNSRRADNASARDDDNSDCGAATSSRLHDDYLDGARDDDDCAIDNNDHHSGSPNGSYDCPKPSKCPRSFGCTRNWCRWIGYFNGQWSRADCQRFGAVRWTGWIGTSSSAPSPRVVSISSLTIFIG